MSNDPNHRQQPLSLLDKAFLIFVFVLGVYVLFHASAVLLDVFLNR